MKMNTKGILIVGMIVGMLCLTAIPVMAAYENDPVEVDNVVSTGTSYTEQRNLVRFDDGTLLCVYTELTLMISEVSYAISDDDGVTWATHGNIGDLGSSDSCIAKDSHERVWCVYEVDGDSNHINVSYYTEGGIWADPVTVYVNESDQYEPFVCVDSHDNVYVIWDQDTNVSGDFYYQVYAVNFTFAQFPDSIPSPVYVDSAPIDQEFPSAAFDGDDTIHIVWDTDTGAEYSINYTYREYGDTDYTSSIDVRPFGHSGDFYDSGICTDETGTVYIVGDLEGDTDNIYVIYGTHPDGTDFYNLTDELGHNTSAWGISCGWLNDELQILYSDYDIDQISYINGTPADGWTLQAGISSAITPTGHMYPSLRWAYWNEQHYTVEYAFTYMFMMEGPGSDVLYYQQIEHGTSTGEVVDQINALLPVVITMMGFLILVAVLRVIVISFKKSFKN
jgi:hypothetical protein